MGWRPQRPGLGAIGRRLLLLIWLPVLVGAAHFTVAEAASLPCAPEQMSPAPAFPGSGSSPFLDPCRYPLDSSPSPEQLVVRIHFADESALRTLTGSLDVWEVNHRQGVVVALITPEQRAWLEGMGYAVTVDAERTATLPVPGALTAREAGSLPGFACYRTVEETFADLARLATERPDIAEWIDIGDTYDKVTPGGPDGYDIHALVLTNKRITGIEKGKFVLMAALHARELATAELATRYAELLIDSYGVDPDLTWLLDYNEIHIIPQANPDGRKWAEQGYSWRKNTDSPAACGSAPNNAPFSYGVDLNRNSSFLWNICLSGCSSADPCSVVYRGPSAASEPEVQAIETYLRAVFPDQRGPNRDDPAPADTNGVFISLHSYGGLVIYPWDWTGSDAPNRDELRRLGRKFGYFNRYGVCNTSNCLYAVDGSTTDFAYGELGVATYTYEVGTTFFEQCSYFEDTLLQKNLDSLVYAAKVARRPYRLPAGPDTTDVTVTPRRVAAGVPVTLTATTDDTRYYSHGFGVEPSQAITAARYTVNGPSWIVSPTVSLAPVDGAFDSSTEAVMATLDTSGWKAGHYALFVESQDADGNWGPPTAVELTIDTDFGLDVRQEPAAAFVAPGESVTFTVTVTNTGSAQDGFAVTIEEAEWDVTFPEIAWSAAAGENTTVPVTVTAPQTATVGATGVTILRIASRGDPSRYRVVTLQTIVDDDAAGAKDGTPAPVYLPLIGKE